MRLRRVLPLLILLPMLAGTAHGQWAPPPDPFPRLGSGDGLDKGWLLNIGASGFVSSRSAGPGFDLASGMLVGPVGILLSTDLQLHHAFDPPLPETSWYPELLTGLALQLDLLQRRQRELQLRAGWVWGASSLWLADSFPLHHGIELGLSYSPWRASQRSEPRLLGSYMDRSLRPALDLALLQTTAGPRLQLGLQLKLRYSQR